MINTKHVNFLKQIRSSIKLYSLKKQSNYYIKNKDQILKTSVKEITRNIENDKIFIRTYETDNQSLIEKGTKYNIEKLEFTRHVLENSKNLISGAIGENLVVKEIKKPPVTTLFMIFICTTMLLI
ncbi:hypothetical protein [Psychroserpens damuponensis]|uniref:hypothetical protein n=1 Tax=Psychroserpens damuponensis TaxID=943936 RepID=UPI00126A49DB|nr:hypothetical protein [Psychroserpens damuponensis]